jgi:signal recognition particle GTPase
MIISEAVMEIFERFHQYNEEWCKTHPEEMKKIVKEVKKIREKQMKEMEKKKTISQEKANLNKARDKVAENMKAVDDHRHKMSKIANAIHELIVKNDLSVSEANYILNMVTRRVAYFSQVVALDPDNIPPQIEY